MHAPAPRREPARDPRRATRTDSLEDAALIARLRADDETALDVLLLRFWTPLVAYAERLVGTRDAAEDIVQRTFCRVWERRGAWRTSGSLCGLLYRIAHNLAVSDRRTGQARERAALSLADALPDAASPLDDVERTQLRHRIARAVRALPDRRQQVFVLRCVHELSYREIADTMGISTQTVANQFSHALATLRCSLAYLSER
jgi:RNA polymerase sigma-70 factor (ECF subfamily)